MALKAEHPLRHNKKW
uniref:Uncharacterized protein n=1 Tax=Arundo donax TaxID=35708 RepID=A0A0A8Y108_ARUDO